MVTMFNPKPQLLRAVDKPDNVSSQEIAKARPVYIDGLPEGGGGGGGGPITSDAITIDGTSNDELNGTQLNDYFTGIGDLIGTLMTDIGDLQDAQADLKTRLEAIEALPPSGQH